MDPNELTNLIRLYCLGNVGTPYRWGGDDPLHGFDCSGWAQEVCMAFGALKRGISKMRAQDLYRHFRANGVVLPPARLAEVGALAFFGKDEQSISHVGVCVSPIHMVHAGSGDSSTVTPARAAEQNAFLRIDLIRYRQDLVGIYLPRYVR